MITKNVLREYISVTLYAYYIYESALGVYVHGNPSTIGITIRQLLMLTIVLLNYKIIAYGVHVIKTYKITQILMIYYIYSAIAVIVMTDQGKTKMIYENISTVIEIVLLVSMIGIYRDKTIHIMFTMIATIYIIAGYTYVQQYLPPAMYIVHVNMAGVAHQSAGQMLMYANTIMIHSTRRRHYHVAVFIMVINTILVVLTGARTASIVNIVITIAYLGGKRRILYIGAIAAIVALYASALSFEWSMNRWKRLYDAYKYGDVSSATEVELRVNNTSVAWSLFLQNPLFGIGPGNWKNRIMNTYVGDYYVYYGPHSSLDMLAQQGIVGVTLFYIPMIMSLIINYPKRKTFAGIGVYAVSAALMMSIGGSTLTKWEIVPMYSLGLCYATRNGRTA